MDKEKGFYALDDSVLDAVTGGVEPIAADTKDVSDEVRLNLFGNENTGIAVQRSTLEKVIGFLWNR